MKKFSTPLKSSFLGLLCLFGLTACAAKSAAPKEPEATRLIVLSGDVKISLLPWINNTGLSEQETWPRDPGESGSLFTVFTEITKEFKTKISRHSRFNRIKMVHQSEFPDFRIQLDFRKAINRNNQWTIPVDIHIYDQSSSKGDFSITLEPSAAADFLQKPDEKTYYWFQVLGDYQRSFPHALICRKIFSSEIN